MPLFKQQKILLLDDMVKVENIRLMYRVCFKTAPPPIVNLYKKQTHFYGTRCEGFVTPIHKLKKCHDSFLVRAIVHWNSINQKDTLAKKLKPLLKYGKQKMLSTY